MDVSYSKQLYRTTHGVKIFKVAGATQGVVNKATFEYGDITITQVKYFSQVCVRC